MGGGIDPRYFYLALQNSSYITGDINAADAVFVYDYCYMIWCCPFSCLFTASIAVPTSCVPTTTAVLFRDALSLACLLHHFAMPYSGVPTITATVSALPNSRFSKRIAT